MSRRFCLGFKHGFYSGSRLRDADFVAGFGSWWVAHANPHISRDRTLNRTILNYVASFKVYFRSSKSEKSNPGE